MLLADTDTDIDTPDGLSLVGRVESLAPAERWCASARRSSSTRTCSAASRR